MGTIKAMTFEEYYNEHRQRRTPDASWLRAQAEMSGAQIARAEREYLIDLYAYYEERAALREEYDKALEAGVVRMPTRLERLEALAAGHPDLQSTKSARAVLKRVKAKMKVKGSGEEIKHTKSDA